MRNLSHGAENRYQKLVIQPFPATCSATALTKGERVIGPSVRNSRVQRTLQMA
ncbi:MAG: hypothetical protein V1792_11115 [Pseudomonadota bacterium]